MAAFPATSFVTMTGVPVGISVPLVSLMFCRVKRENVPRANGEQMCRYPTGPGFVLYQS